jgi:hypothetical protein
MNDSYYIKASERDQMQDAVDAVPRVTPGMLDDVCSSHAVADDVMRELAEALRWNIDDDECSFDHHGGCQTHDQNEGEAECMMVQMRRIVARYDRMTGGSA